MNSYMKYCMHCIAFIDDEKLTRPMQLRLMHPFGSSSSDCALFTCALIVSPLQRGYNLSILSNSFFGHSQTGHSIVLHIVVGKRSWLQDGPSGPCVRTRHNGAVVVETSHCTYSKINSYLNAMPNSYMN